MPFITSVERIGIEKGMQIGEQRGTATVLRRQWQRRFGVLPEWAATQIMEADLATLETWTDRVLDAKTLEEVLMTKN
ncbi:MAG: DUF4351 domain-containing protein [Magnetococcales bacterium]|nr:DUF4351 domain-containing protein [Magnetococcales bacterium]NGZ28463.1 DUF4351 domain-containing protein [Magnetococcales bacterium]